MRKFTDESLTDEHLIRILDAARLCQSGKNLQPWYFIVVRDRSTLDELAELMKGDVDIVFEGRFGRPAALSKAAFPQP